MDNNLKGTDSLYNLIKVIESTIGDDDKLVELDERIREIDKTAEYLTFDEFALLLRQTMEIKKYFNIKLIDKYTFCYGIHGSMTGSYVGFFIRREIYPDYKMCVMDNINYTTKELYNYMLNLKLLKNLDLKIEEAILNGA